MNKWIKISLWSLATLMGAFAVFAVWYKQTYSMSVVASYEVNDPSRRQHILIATQGSEFKDSIVHQLVREFRSRQFYIKVIDVSKLSQINDEAWSAIIILHTWEYSKPPKAVQLFVQRMQPAGTSGKLIILTTSGGGDYKMQGIDAVTAPSQIDKASKNATEIIRRVNDILTYP
jgi:hypothetical protein